MPLALRHTENLEAREISKFGQVSVGVDKGLIRIDVLKFYKTLGVDTTCPDTNPVSVACQPIADAKIAFTMKLPVILIVLSILLNLPLIQMFR